MTKRKKGYSDSNKNLTLFEVEKICGNKSTLLSQSTQKLLRLMVAELKINSAATASLLEIAEVDKQLVQYIAGPVITSTNCWQSCIPQWVYKAVTIDRLDTVLEEIEKGSIGELATPSEVLTVMMPISLEAPLHSDWVNVYLWASHTTLVKHKPFPNYDYENLWAKIGTSPINYKQIQHNYKTLAADIRSRVVSYAAKQGWGKRHKSPEKLTTNESQTTNIARQLTLFE